MPLAIQQVTSAVANLTNRRHWSRSKPENKYRADK